MNEISQYVLFEWQIELVKRFVTCQHSCS